MSHGPTSFVSAFILLASLVLSTMSAAANVLSLADVENFHKFNLKTQPIADNLDALLINPPMQGGRDAAIATQNCMVRLIANFGQFKLRIEHLGVLVGLAARMADSGDESAVVALLSITAPAFLEQIKTHRQMLDATKAYCSRDGATVAKVQEISRTYDDANALAGSIIKKIFAKPN
jgi:hypothetical protein